MPRGNPPSTIPTDLDDDLSIPGAVEGSDDDLLDPELDARAAAAKAKDDEIAALKARDAARDAETAELRGLFHRTEGRLDEVSRYNASAAEDARKKELRPEIAEPTRADISKAMADGDFDKAAELLELQANAKALKSTRLLHDTAIEPLRAGLQDVGLPAVAAMRVDQVVATLPEHVKGIYVTNREAILSHVALLPVNQQVEPNAIKALIATHYGASMMDESAFNATVEAEVQRRLRNDKTPNVSPTGRTLGRDTMTREDRGGARDWREVFGAEAESAAMEYGGWDGWASRVLGYPNMAAYAKKAGF